MRRVLVFLFVLALVVGAVGPVGAKPPVREPVTVVGPYVGPEADALVAELESVAKNRFEIFYEGELFGDDLLDRVRSGGVDLVIGFPDTFAELASDPGVVDLSEFVNPRKLRRDYGDYLIDVASVNGVPVGGPIQAQLKSLVWYKPDAFAANGYAIPETFIELVALSDGMVADGNTPWCNYIEAGAGTGFVGTDWVEDLLLGAEGPEVYDQWVDHTVVFQDPRVELAFERFQQMIDTPGYVFDRGNMLDANIFWNAIPLGDGDCLMHKQADFFAGALAGFGYDLDEFATFKFPSVDTAYADAAVGGGATWVAALNERREVRQLVRFMLSQRFGRDAIAELGGWILPNIRFDTSRYTSDLTRSFGEDIQAALRADQFRFDASDQMPPEVGSGSFFQGIVDLVDLTLPRKDIPTILKEIDDSWPSHYEVIEDPATWHDAAEYCEQDGGHLATINSAEENQFVYDLVADIGNQLWLGATDEAVEGTWEWVTGEPFDYTNWGPGEPNNSAPGPDPTLGEDYLTFHGEGAYNPPLPGVWNDWQYETDGSDSTLPFVCEYEPAT